MENRILVSRIFFTYVDSSVIVCCGNENLLKLPRGEVYDIMRIVKTKKIWGPRIRFEDMTICNLSPHTAPSLSEGIAFQLHFFNGLITLLTSSKPKLMRLIINSRLLAAH
jgi:hypothetical protein